MKFFTYQENQAGDVFTIRRKLRTWVEVALFVAAVSGYIIILYQVALLTN